MGDGSAELEALLGRLWQLKGAGQRRERYEGELAGMEADALAAHAAAVSARLARVKSWDVWGAAYLMQDGCSDDEFADLCAGLTFAEPQVYEAVAADASALFEHSLYDFSPQLTFALANALEQAGIELTRTEVSGTPWTESNVADRFPAWTQAQQAGEVADTVNTAPLRELFKSLPANLELTREAYVRQVEACGLHPLFEREMNRVTINSYNDDAEVWDLSPFSDISLGFKGKQLTIASAFVDSPLDEAELPAFMEEHFGIRTPPLDPSWPALEKGEREWSGVEQVAGLTHYMRDGKAILITVKLR